MFFGGNSYWLGLIIIIVLDLVVLACILAFRNVNKLAAYLFVPYFVLDFIRYLFDLRSSDDELVACRPIF